MLLTYKSLMKTDCSGLMLINLITDQITPRMRHIWEFILVYLSLVKSTKLEACDLIESRQCYWVFRRRKLNKAMFHAWQQQTMCHPSNLRLQYLLYFILVLLLIYLSFSSLWIILAKLFIISVSLKMYKTNLNHMRT